MRARIALLSTAMVLADMSGRAGTYTVNWDGKDDNGDDLPAGRYSWHAAVSTVTGAYDNQVGDPGTQVGDPGTQVGDPGTQVGDPGTQVGNKPTLATETPSEVSAVAYDAAGNLYTDSQSKKWDALRKYPPGTVANGSRSWYMPGGTARRGYSLAVDDANMYVAARDDAGPNLLIYRTDAGSGDDHAFTGVPYITVNGAWSHGQPVVTGLAVDQHYLLVSYNNTLLAFNKESGATALVLHGQSSMSLDGVVHGIATDGSGTYWIAVGAEVRKYTMDTAGQKITDVQQPYGLAWDRSNGRSLLYISDAGTGKIRAYDVSATPRDTKPAQFDHLGLMDGPGLVDNSHFGWQLDTLSAMGHDASIAVSRTAPRSPSPTSGTSARCSSTPRPA